MTAYVTGLKHWCATVHDLFISQVESELSTGVKTGQVASAHFHKQAAAHQKAAVKSSSRKAFRTNPMCHAEWRKYKESFTLSPTLSHPMCIILFGGLINLIQHMYSHEEADTWGQQCLKYLLNVDVMMLSHSSTSNLP
eukprot:Blabericola_migrator_1__10487@NODE_5941_length_637_cov_4_707018_g3940_i0_p1_GENE_NODE_5941_length_637_cov_4_707018_g3940_i0NODE_5941_length_637_cov_4_707018_g3940_i0_p1_ORF_typecomplete_len138_score15_11DUF2855/PF11017_8/0_055DUF3526/PF12040_8/0_1_NODE_5941_length_637_cov_4_707018_g3940_i0150563